MKPFKFKQCNVTFAKDQPEYQQLPALKLDTPQGEVISCWKLSFVERITIIFTGKIWLQLLSFNKPLTPSYITLNRKELFTTPEGN
jgi:hypothetical protein